MGRRRRGRTFIWNRQRWGTKHQWVLVDRVGAPLGWVDCTKYEERIPLRLGGRPIWFMTSVVTDGAYEKPYEGPDEEAAKRAVERTFLLVDAIRRLGGSALREAR